MSAKGHAVRRPEAPEPAATTAAASPCERLVESSMPAIRSMARRYRRTPLVDEADLVQAGVVGVLRAAERFDPAFEAPFWAYACWWVRSAMQEVVADLSRPCVLSDRALRELACVAAAEREHASERLSDDELGSLTGLSREHLDALRAAGRAAMSLEEPAGPGADARVGDLIGDPRAVDPSERALLDDTLRQVKSVMGELEPRERTVVAARYPSYGRPRTLGDLGAELGVSAERVRQIERGALDKLRVALG